MKLVIGNKNYSSWSLRPWLLAKQAGIPFEEIRVRLLSETFAADVARHSPAGRVPVLVDDGFAVWDSLAIVEYAAERFPDHGVWPRDAKARARARSICAEMHSGFGDLRNHCPMNIEAALPEVGARLWREQAGLRADVERVAGMWTALLQEHGGPMLFGAFSAADAFYAPVCTRIRTYALPVPAEVSGYIDRVYALPAVKAWVDEALREHDFIAFDEPYRAAP